MHCIYVCMCVCLFVYLHLRMCVHVCRNVYACVYIYKDILATVQRELIKGPLIVVHKAWAKHINFVVYMSGYG